MKSIPGAHKIDLSCDPRRDHFAYFSTMAYPYVGLTAQVDISPIVGFRQRTGAPFFLTLLYCVGRAANSVPQLRQRIVEGEIWEFDACLSSFTVAKPDETYAYCPVRTDLPFDVYLTQARAQQKAAQEGGNIEESPEEALSCYFISSLPWMGYTALVQPVPSPADSNPRITWGKAEMQDGRLKLPLSLLCHHALVDGLHIARFYQALDRELARLDLSE